MNARRPRFLETAVFGLCVTVASLVLLAVVWSGDAPYAGLVRPTREQAEVHSAWVNYVTGRSGAQPGGERGEWQPTTLERSHMADVRGVFIAAELAALVAGLIALWLLLRADRGDHALLLIRNAALGALVLVVALGLFAAVAFDAAFLLFHQLFFPQGNFLFPPNSSLMRLYPESYFYGLTVRIAVSFLTLAATAAAVAQFRLRGHRGTA